MLQSSESEDMIHRIAALLPLLLGPAAAAAADSARYEVVKHRNLVYNPAKDADKDKHKLDLYVPKGAKDFPVMMFVHGGAWKSGNKELYAAWARRSPARGSAPRSSTTA